MKNRKDWPLLILSVAVLLAAYVSIYFALSRFGKYMPKETNSNGTIAYEWTPAIFSDPNDKVFEKIFFPMRQLDVRYIHTPAKATSGKYPVEKPL